MVKLRLKKMAYSKQLFIMLLLACSTLLLIVFKTSAVYTGSASDPFPIRDISDLYKMAECIKVNKNWSNSKHFSLPCDIELPSAISISTGSSEHEFNGFFHGNGHTITLKSGTLFGKIGTTGIVEHLTIRGNGYIANDNSGKIERCYSYTQTSYGMMILRGYLLLTRY